VTISTRVSLLFRTVIAAGSSVALTSAVVVAALLLIGVPVYVGIQYGVEAVSSHPTSSLVAEPLATALVVAVAITCLAAVELSLRTVRTARGRSAPAGALAQGTVELGSYMLLVSSLLIVLAALPFLQSVLPNLLFVFLVLLGFFYLITAGYLWAAHEWVRSKDEADDERTTGGNWLVVGVFIIGYLSVSYWTGFALLVVAALVWLVFGAIIAPNHIERVRDTVERRAAESAEEEPVEPAAVYGITDEVGRTRTKLEQATGLHPIMPVAVAGIGVVGASYWTAAFTSVETTAVSVASVGAVAFVGIHVGATLRAEATGNTAVLRDLEDRFDLEVLRDTEASGQIAEIPESPTDWDVDENTSLNAIVTRLARQANLPSPEIQILEHSTPLALTVGYRPTTSTLVLSQGLIETLDNRELEAVIAHELAHVANRDAAVLTALSVPSAVARLARSRYGYNPVIEPLSRLVRTLSRWYVALVSRGREYAADDSAVAITGGPAPLANALETLDTTLDRRPSTDLRKRDTAAAFAIVPPPWEEHPFFDRTRRFIARRIFGTHPPTEKRIERLRARV
jgi:heat shock protein HtpX